MGSFLTRLSRFHVSAAMALATVAFLAVPENAFADKGTDCYQSCKAQFPDYGDDCKACINDCIWAACEDDEKCIEDNCETACNQSGDCQPAES